MRHKATSAIYIPARYCCSSTAAALQKHNYMCEYFWWKCETCGITQDYILLCQFNINHVPCRQTKKVTLLPTITPPPTCQCCGDIRGARRPIFSIPTHAKQHISKEDLPPELNAILNDELFWVNPALRQPNFEQTLAKYNNDRNHIFEEAEKVVQENEKAGAASEDTTGKHDAVRTAWQQLRNALVLNPGIKKCSE